MLLHKGVVDWQHLGFWAATEKDKCCDFSDLGTYDKLFLGIDTETASSFAPLLLACPGYGSLSLSQHGFPTVQVCEASENE